MEFFKRLFFVCVFCCTPVLLNAQHLDTLMAHAQVFLKAKDYEQAEKLYYEALSLAQELGELEKQGVIYNNLGIRYKRQANYVKSIEMYNKSLAIYDIIENDTLAAGAELNLGNTLNKMGLYEVSLPHFSRSLEIATKIGDRSLEANICSVLGTVNYNLKHYNLSEEYHIRSLQIYADFNDEDGMSKVLHNRAELYLETDDLKKAEECLRNEKSINSKLDQSLISNTVLYGELYQKKQNWDSAYYCFNTALQERIQTGDITQLSSSYYHLADYYHGMNEPNKCMDYLDSAYFWSDSLRQNNMTLEVLELQLRSELYGLKDQKIYDKYQKWIAFKDSLIGARAHDINLAFSNDYEFLKKNKEIEVNQAKMKLKDAENKNLNFKYELALLGLLVFLVLVLIIFFLSVRVRKKNERLSAQNETIQKLHSELNHRTKNYYQMFGGMLYDDLENEENESVKEVLRHYLSRVNAMSQIQHHLVYAEEQAQQKIQLDVYLGQLIDEIDLALNHKEFQVSIRWNMESVAIDYHKALHIGIVLNELFQNAFKHGFHGISNPEIKVDLVSEDAFYKLVIQDNGIGIDGNSSVKKRSKGMGLMTDLMRKIKGQLAFDSNENGGVKAELIFPK